MKANSYREALPSLTKLCQLWNEHRVLSRPPSLLSWDLSRAHAIGTRASVSGRGRERERKEGRGRERQREKEGERRRERVGRESRERERERMGKEREGVVE